MRDEIVLIGPPFAGKSTVGKLLAEELSLPQASLDDLRWKYFREIGYDEVLAKELRYKGGFVSLVAYWCLFNTHATERLFAEHRQVVFDFGGGPIVFENSSQRAKIQSLFAPFRYVIRLLPSPDLARSVAVLQQRGTHLIGTNAQGFDWTSYFVYHTDNFALAKHHVYTEGKTAQETCQEILAWVRK